MLYGLLITVIILAISCPLVGVFCFIKGYNLKAEKLGETVIKPPILKSEEPEVDERLQTLLHNIDAYDGSPKGQVEIK